MKDSNPMTKHYLWLLVTALFITPCYAQNVAINEDGSLPHGKAIPDIKSTTKGILIPRMSSANRGAISAPKGLLVAVHELHEQMQELRKKNENLEKENEKMKKLLNHITNK